MKRKLFSVAAIVVVLTLGLGPAGAPSAYALEASSPVGETQVRAIASVAVGLTADELAGLKYMREEEKLARDVYVVFYGKWGLGLFSSISRSEQMHMDAVKTLLDRYGVPDPASGKGPGKFTNTFLQGLYNDLVAQGQASPEAALNAAGLVEEVDILDLRLRLSQTNKTDIQSTYTHLMNGSYNHLRAFSSVYQQQTGTPYTPQRLSLEDYNTIISGAGGRSGGGGGGCCRGGCGG